MRFVLSAIFVLLVAIPVGRAVAPERLSALASPSPGAQNPAPTPPANESSREQSVKIVKPVPPVFPADMTRGEVTGAVRMQLVIDPTGKVIAVTVTSKLHPKLDAAAVAAAKQWEYSVPMFNDVPVYALVYTAVRF